MPFNNIVRYEKYRPESRIKGARRSALEAVTHLLEPLPGLSLAHRQELLTIALWKWTEASGIPPHAKFNLQFASSRALNQAVPAKVNHEYVWTCEWIIAELLRDNRSWSEAELEDFLERYGVACVVTLEEHGRLEGGTVQGWRRYRRASIEVLDLQKLGPLDLTQTSQESDDAGPNAELDRSSESDSLSENALKPVHLMVGAAGSSVSEALDDLAGSKAASLKRLVRWAELAGAVAIVGTTKDPDRPVGAYVRVHDATIGASSRAVAYIHWSGKVSLGLLACDVPEAMLAETYVSSVKHKTYGIQSRVSNPQSLDVTEDLLLLALEKLRGIVGA